MDFQDIKAELRTERDEWRNLRNEKLRRKDELLSQGMDKRDVRRDREYKRLKKRQGHLFKNIQHIEKRLNKKISRLNTE